MSTNHNIQFSRYEFKYVVDEPTAAEIQRFIRNYVQPDAHTVGREGRGYAVHSLYLDSADFLTCRATLHGEKNRFKLRLRFYDDDPDSPIYLEVKRRLNLVILKQRAAVRRSSAQRLLEGESLTDEDLGKMSPAMREYAKAVTSMEKSLIVYQTRWDPITQNDVIPAELPSFVTDKITVDELVAKMSASGKKYAEESN